MKTLDELYYELREHPDCLHLDIIDKERVVDDVRDALDYFNDVYVDEDNEVPEETLDQLALEWYDEHRQILKLKLQNYYTKNNDYWEFDYHSIEDWFTLKTNNNEKP